LAVELLFTSVDVELAGMASGAEGVAMIRSSTHAKWQLGTFRSVYPYSLADIIARKAQFKNSIRFRQRTYSVADHLITLHKYPKRA